MLAGWAAAFQEFSGDVAAAYLDSIRPVMALCGLRFPDRGALPLELPPQVDLSVPA